MSFFTQISGLKTSHFSQLSNSWTTKKKKILVLGIQPSRAKSHSWAIFKRSAWGIFGCWDLEFPRNCWPMWSLLQLFQTFQIIHQRTSSSTGWYVYSCATWSVVFSSLKKWGSSSGQNVFILRSSLNLDVVNSRSGAKKKKYVKYGIKHPSATNFHHCGQHRPFTILMARTLRKLRFPATGQGTKNFFALPALRTFAPLAAGLEILSTIRIWWLASFPK